VTLKEEIAQYMREVTHEPDAPPFNLPIEHWSASSLDMLNRCPYQWQQRYLRGRKERPGEAQTTGSTVHAGVEHNFKQKVESHEDLPTAELLDWFDDEGFKAVVEREQEAKGEVVWDPDGGPEKAQARGRAMLGAYHTAVAPRVQPLAVEGEFLIPMFELPIPMKGYIDIERESSIIDLKTSKQKRSTPKETWWIQAAVYGEAKAKPVEFHSVSMTKTGKLDVLTLLEAEGLYVNFSAGERETMALNLRVLSALACFYMDMFGPDEDWPARGRLHTWACDYCGFREGCPAWRE